MNFSKFGKVCNERFYILKYKDDILSGEKRRISPKRSTLASHKRQLSPENLTKLINSISSRDQSPSERSIQKSPAFLAQTRDNFYNSSWLRNSAPPCGHYNAKYDLVKKNLRHINIKERPLTSSRLPKTQNDFGFVFPLENLQRHIPSAIPLDKQTPRPEFTKNTKDVNEKRFIMYDHINEHISKYRRTATPSLAKSRPRDNKYLLNQTENSPSYEPSFKLVSDDLGKVAKFNNYNSHKPILLSHLINTRDYQINYGLIEKRVNIPDFTKTSPRTDDSSPLPCFMQPINSRLGLEVINEKMLLMNSSLSHSKSSTAGPAKVRSPNSSILMP